MSIDIDKTISGDIVKFANPAAGHHDDRKQCRRLLVVGENYQIESIHVYDWHTDVQLVGIKDVFNSVMFDNIKTFTNQPPTRGKAL